MKMIRHLAYPVLACAVLAGCAGTTTVRPISTPALAEVTLTPNDPDNPTEVRFDVPTSAIMGLPGDRIPVTLEARIGTREIAARELAAAGYCPNGFRGPDGVFFPNGDRSRSAFIVECVGR